MKALLAASSQLLLQVAAAQAAFTDFSDYTQSQDFELNETFHSNDLTFKAVQFHAIARPVWINVEASYAYLLPGPGVEFLLPANVQEVSMSYSDGAGIGIVINGVEPSYPPPGSPGNPYPAGFGFLDGKSVAGVEITTSLSTDLGNYQAGLLRLRGPINSLVIAGLELSLDDVCVLVPEPSAAGLFGVGAVTALAAHRRTLSRGRLSRGVL